MTSFHWPTAALSSKEKRRKNKDSSQYISAILKNLKDSLVDKKKKKNMGKKDGGKFWKTSSL